MDPIELQFFHERTTKGTERYKEAEDGTPPCVGTIYIKKYSLPQGSPPKELKVTVEAVG